MGNNRIKNSRILVTGGAGFIGSNLCQDLLAHGNYVRCLDNFSTGKPANLETFADHPHFELMTGDIRHLEDCKRAVNDIEFVLHHAALGSVPRSIHDPKTSHEVNVSGFLNMLQAAQVAGVARFIYASSSAVYGDHPGLPKQKAFLGTPLSPYAVTKRSNELYAQSFKKIYSMDIIGLRYFNVFGPRQDPNGPYAAVIPKFVETLMNHCAPVIHGNGLQSRDFTYIDNVVYANHLALQAVLPEKNDVFNIACESQVSLLEMVSLMRTQLTHYDQKIAYIQPLFDKPRPGDIMHSRACIKKAQKFLGYQPLCDFQEGLKQSIEWYWNKKACPNYVA